jgi:thiosulfate/3-mercaptopyruvate sulfurtransferase
MSTPALPLLLEPDELQTRLGAPGLLVIGLCKPTTYAQAHVPGAVNLDYAQLVRANPPAMGLLPDAEHLQKIFSAIGLTPDTHVVTYDDEGGGRAARLLWTLDVIGHKHASLLNGGLHAWLNEDHPLESTPNYAAPGEYPVRIDEAPIADKNYILQHLNDPSVALLDARSIEEYTGERRFSARGGHIPGAVNIDWQLLMDQDRNLRLKPVSVLRAMLEERGVTPDKTIVTYCQTHHRSALSYFVLNYLGHPRIKGYPGSWSEWGNDAGTPIEAGH